MFSLNISPCVSRDNMFSWSNVYYRKVFRLPYGMLSDSYSMCLMGQIQGDQSPLGIALDKSVNIDGTSL